MKTKLFFLAGCAAVALAACTKYTETTTVFKGAEVPEVIPFEGATYVVDLENVVVETKATKNTDIAWAYRVNVGDVVGEAVVSEVAAKSFEVTIPANETHTVRPVVVEFSSDNAATWTAVVTASQAVNPDLAYLPTYNGGVNLPAFNFGAYYGDYYGIGTGNIMINICEGYPEEDEYGEIAGTFDIFCIDANVPVVEGDPVPDAVHLAPGTYTVDPTDAGTEFTINASYSYVYKVANDVEEIGMVPPVSGKIVVENVGENLVKLSIDVVLADGTEYKKVVEVNSLITNSDETFDGVGSNLPKNVYLDPSTFTQAAMYTIGDMFYDGVSETWVVSLGDDHYDLNTDWGYGHGLLIYINVAPGADIVGTYSKFLDPWTSVSGEVNTLFGGMTMMGMYAGCYYTFPVYGYSAALNNGTLEVTKATDESGAEVYTFKGTLGDRNGNSVNFEYTGEVAEAEIEYLSTSTKAGFKNSFKARNSALKLK